MMHLELKPGKQRLTCLCVGAHSDDIEIGCGGAVLRLAAQYPQAEFHWVVFSAIGTREQEARHGAASFAGKNLKQATLHGFRDGFMPYQGGEVKDIFEQMKQAVDPDFIFTTSGRDAHQDHRLISELTWNTFRDHMILEYEIPKYDGDLGQPNLFVPLEKSAYQGKVDLLMSTFKSQQSKRWFEPETFLALMRLRGMECNSASGYAEAFYCRKIIL